MQFTASVTADRDQRDLVVAGIYEPAPDADQKLVDDP